jgi:hypothetical protein
MVGALEQRVREPVGLRVRGRRKPRRTGTDDDQVEGLHELFVGVEDISDKSFRSSL